jgi:hypothetical protein
MMHGAHIGGVRAAGFRELVRATAPERVLLVGVDVAKATWFVVASTLLGEVVVDGVRLVADRAGLAEEDLIRKAYDAFGSGDRDTIEELFADNIAFHVSGRNLPGDYVARIKSSGSSTAWRRLPRSRSGPSSTTSWRPTNTPWPFSDTRLSVRARPRSRMATCPSSMSGEGRSPRSGITRATSTRRTSSSPRLR